MGPYKAARKKDADRIRELEKVINAYHVESNDSSDAQNERIKELESRLKEAVELLNWVFLVHRSGIEICEPIEKFILKAMESER